MLSFACYHRRPSCKTTRTAQLLPQAADPPPARGCSFLTTAGEDMLIINRDHKAVPRPKAVGSVDADRDAADDKNVTAASLFACRLISFEQGPLMADVKHSDELMEALGYSTPRMANMTTTRTSTHTFVYDSCAPASVLAGWMPHSQTLTTRLPTGPSAGTLPPRLASHHRCWPASRMAT